MASSTGAIFATGQMAHASYLANDRQGAGFPPWGCSHPAATEPVVRFKTTDIVDYPVRETALALAARGVECALHELGD